MPPAENQPLLLRSLGMHRGPGLLSLLPSIPSPSYRLRAEICHLHFVPRPSEKPSVGSVGIFFLCQKLPTPAGLEYYFCQVTFSDRGANAGSLHWSACRLREAGLNSTSLINTMAYVTPRFQRTPADQPAPWHQLIVEVRPEVVTLFWDNPYIPLDFVPYKNLEEGFRPLLKKNEVPAALPPLHLRGTVGLYLSNTIAQFRNVIVEPLVDK
jgi:hypothetical protein